MKSTDTGPVSDSSMTVDGLEVRYGGIVAIRGISFTIGPGEVVALVGANGAGKSTTLRTISGLVRASRGRILHGEQDLLSLSPADIVRRGVVHVPEGRRIFGRLTVRENLILGHYTQRKTSSVHEALERAYEMFPRLRERQNQLGATLSGGEQQMLAIARALMVTPKILLLDEPSLGLAPLLVRRIFETIRRINEQGVSILLVEQNANMALRIADRGYVLQTGQVVMEGPGPELLRDDRVQKSYLGAL